MCTAVAATLQKLVIPIFGHQGEEYLKYLKKEDCVSNWY